MTEEPILIGKIVGTFGLKGFLKVWPLTDFPERFEPGRSVLLDGEPREIIELHWHKKQARLKLEGINNISRAEELVGKELFVPSSDLPKLGEGEYLADSLIGLEVFDQDGRRLGKLEEVISAPAHDMYRIGTALVPAVSEFVIDVDLEGGRIVIRPIPGMFDDAN